MGVSADSWKHTPEGAAAAAASMLETPPVVIGTPMETEAMTSNATAESEANAAADVKQLDLVFTMDCTGSMGSYIAAAKQNIESIVDKLAAQEKIDLRFGLVAYRDHPPQDQTYVTRTFAFCASVEEMRANLSTLSAQGGGDGPEAVEAGLKDTLEMPWRPAATKVCILIADAPPHGLGESNDGFPEGAPTGVDPLVVLDQMSVAGICIYAVGCQPALGTYRFATDFFIAAAERTNGQAVALGSAAKLADVIMGGAIEECDLQGLMAEMQQQVQQLGEAEPGLAEEEVQSRVCSAMQSKGLRTRQMRTAKLSSDFGGLVSAAPSLAAAKASLSAAAPPPPPRAAFGEERGMSLRRCRGGGGGSSFRGMGGLAATSPAYSPASAAYSAGGMPPPPPPPCAAPAMMFRSASMGECDMSEPVYRGLGAGAAPEEEEDVRLEEAEISLEQVKRMMGKAKKVGALGGSAMSATAAS